LKSLQRSRYLDRSVGVEVRQRHGR
jgi:hypothetical protein